MRKILIILAMLGISVMGFAQNKKVDHTTLDILQTKGNSMEITESVIYYSDHTTKTIITLHFLLIGGVANTVLDSYDGTW